MYVRSAIPGVGAPMIVTVAPAGRDCSKRPMAVAPGEVPRSLVLKARD
jgi:hypothetical protein